MISFGSFAIYHASVCFFEKISQIVSLIFLLTNEKLTMLSAAFRDMTVYLFVYFGFTSLKY